MLKQKRQLFEYLFVAADLFVVTIAWVLAYWLRFESGWVLVDKGIPALRHYLSLLLFIWLIWAFIFKRMGLYKPMRGVRGARELWLLINANTFSVLLLISVTYLFREKSIPFSRLVFVYFGLFATMFTMLERGLLRFALKEIRRRGYNLRYLLIIGTGDVAGKVADKIRENRELGIQLVGCLSKHGDESDGPGGIPVVGAYDQLDSILKNMDIDQLIVALPLEDSQHLPEIMANVGDSLVDVRIVPDVYRFVSLGGAIEEFEGMPVISAQVCPLEGVNLVTKRALDIFASATILLVISPLLLLIGIIVKFSSKGNVFYRQERVSFDGTKFGIYKFRTMSLDAEAEGPKWAVVGDVRVTPVGKFLRSYSLDELPQLFNVLKGDMSLVGPRPERPVFIEEFKKRIPKYMLRHKVPAGITGWAQVNGWRGNTSIDKRIEFDLYYLENWSFFFDLKILFLTIFKGFTDRNAY